jgi:hypothetical protein
VNTFPKLGSCEGFAGGSPASAGTEEAIITGTQHPFGDGLDVIQVSDRSAGLPHFPPLLLGAAASGVSPRRPGGRRLHVDDVEPVAVRSPVDDWRIALHEAGHVVVGRALGEQVGGVTIVAGPDFGGLTWGPLGNSARLSATDADECPDLCEKLAGVMPGPGEPRIDAAEIYAHVFVRVIDLCAGTAAETLLHPDCEPWVAHSDIRQARALASLICSSESAIDAYLIFALAEAKALINQHRAAVLAIARALMIHRTLDAVIIHEIIALAPERARRADWARVQQSAAALKMES